MDMTLFLQNALAVLDDLGAWFETAVPDVAYLIGVVAVAAGIAWVAAGVVVRGDADLAERIDLSTVRRAAVADATVLALFAVVFMPASAAYAALAAFLAVGGRIDLAVRRLPDTVTFPAAAIFAALVAPYAFSPGGPGWSPYLAGVATFVVFYLMAVFAPGSFGLGDVKLGLAVGLALGVFGWAAVLMGVVLAFLVSSLSGMVAVWGTGSSVKGAKVAFGPFLVAGAFSGPVMAAALAEGLW